MRWESSGTRSGDSSSVGVLLFRRFKAKRAGARYDQRISCECTVIINVNYRKHSVVVWRSGSALASISEVNQPRARLVLRWVTVSGFNSRTGHLSRYVASHPGQLSLAIPSWAGAMSTSRRAVMPCGWGVKAGMVRV